MVPNQFFFLKTILRVQTFTLYLKLSLTQAYIIQGWSTWVKVSDSKITHGIKPQCCTTLGKITQDNITQDKMTHGKTTQ